MRPVFRKLSGDLLQALVDAKFVNVTGLPAQYAGNEPEPIQARSCDLGRHDTNNGKMVIYTLDGQVWLKDGYDIDQALLHQLCPNGRGAFVPLSNSEEVSVGYILRRVADPYCDFGGSSQVPVVDGELASLA